jgi:putative transcriptional regulator
VSTHGSKLYTFYETPVFNKQLAELGSLEYMSDALFSEFRQSLEQAVEHASGKRFDLRSTALPAPPKRMTKNEIVKLRERLNCSQALFARVLNVSVKTVQAWEQGVREPSDAALKLLTIAQNRPDVLLS